MSKSTYPAIDPNIIVLIGCCKTKSLIPTPIPAADRYTSNLFRSSLAYANTVSPHIFILSAKHHLLRPSDPVSGYDQELTASAVPAWSRKVIGKLKSAISIAGATFCILAGKDYAEVLGGMLKAEDAKEILTPLEGMNIGQRMQWLNAEALRRSAKQTVASVIEKPEGGKPKPKPPTKDMDEDERLAMDDAVVVANTSCSECGAKKGSPCTDIPYPHKSRFREIHRLLKCPSCKSTASRCKRPSGHEADVWHKDRTEMLEKLRQEVVSGDDAVCTGCNVPQSQHSVSGQADYRYISGKIFVGDCGRKAARSEEISTVLVHSQQTSAPSIQPPSLPTTTPPAPSDLTGLILQQQSLIIHMLQLLLVKQQTEDAGRVA